MKHVALNYHFIQEQVQSGVVRVSHVFSEDQLVDALTKPLSHNQLLLFAPRLDSPLGALSCKGILREIINCNYLYISFLLYNK